MMTPGKASKENMLIEIYHPIGLQRYPAQLFDLDNGIAWIEMGWAEDDPMSRPSNPIHMAEGIVTQTTRNNQWEMATDDGMVIIRILDEETPEDRDLVAELKTYNPGNREQAREAIRADLQITIPKE